MRNLATIRTISSIHAIPGADAIECAVIDGWEVVVKKGEMVAGDQCLYCEIDSLLPVAEGPFSFLAAKASRSIDGKTYFRLRTVKLRGQVSQGLALPLSSLPAEAFAADDLAGFLGILKYEDAEPGVKLSAAGARPFPVAIPRTDQERGQNLIGKIDFSASWESTRKLDGSSCTVYFHDGVLGVCSRNQELILDDPANEGNGFIAVARSSGLLGALERLGMNLAVQGEMAGPGIQKNRAGLAVVGFWAFACYLIDERRYLLPGEQHLMIARLRSEGYIGEECPVHGVGLLPAADMPGLVAYVSSLGDDVEGLVFSCLSQRETFKVINNRYLLKHDL